LVGSKNNSIIAADLADKNEVALRIWLTDDNIEIVYIYDFLRMLWAGELF